MSSHGAGDISRRKAQHLEICLDDARYAVETNRTRLNEVHLVHRSLPELDARDVDPSISFLGHRVALPFFISSMTGGSEEGYRTNKDLAATAQELGVPVGMGSIRILFRKPDVIDHFYLKRYAPDVPVFANIGGVQLPEMDHEEIFRMLQRLQVDGVAVHLNPAQELFQLGGDRDFRGVRSAVARFIERAPLTVIVTETGFGINPAEVRDLLSAGARYVNIAGSGGTNWVRVEAYRRDEPDAPALAGEFDDWGLPTALVLAALGRDTGGVLASGGIRTGIDVVKSVALGAEAAGLALPFVRALRGGGVQAAVDLGRRLEHVIRTAMTLTGSAGVSDLRTAPMWMDKQLEYDARALAEACGERTEKHGGYGRLLDTGNP